MVLKNRFGKIGERAAVRYLRKKGYRILQTNYAKPFGEVDIVAEKDGAIFFAEVKTRQSTVWGEPAEFVTYAKKRRIVLAAKAYICEYNLDCPCSFEVLEVFHNGAKITNIHHIENAFYADF